MLSGRAYRPLLDKKKNDKILQNLAYKTILLL